MPKIQTNAQRKYRYEMIARAEGEQCIVCYIRKLGKRVNRTGKLEIDHADGDRKNWKWSNLHLVCRKHNCELRGMQAHKHVVLVRDYGVQLKREREREGLPTWTSVLKDAIDYDDTLAPLKLNRRYEEPWLQTARQWLMERRASDRKELIALCAAEVDCSIQTSTNYLIKHTGPRSVFKETTDGAGNRIIIFRELPVLRQPPSTPKGLPRKKAKVAGGG